MPDRLAFAAQLQKLEAFRHGQADSTELDEFDAETERLILRTFGETTGHLEAYELATMGEAETIVNIPQSAQEDTAQDIPRKALEQRRQVLEACVAELEAPPKPLQKPSRAPAKKAKKKSTARKKARKVTKKKPTAAKKKRAKRR